MALNHYPIARRIAGGFALVLILLLAVAILGGRGMDAGRVAIDVYSDVAEAALQMKDADARFEELRRHIISGDYDKSDETLRQIEKIVTDTAPMAGTPELSDAVKSVTPLLEHYRTALVRLRAGQAQVDELIAAGDTAQRRIHQVETSQVAFLRATEDDAKSTALRTEVVDGILAAAALVLGAVAAWIIGAGIVRPLRAMTEAMRKLADGDLETAIPSTGGKDEVAAMAEALAVFKANGHKRVQLEAAARAESAGLRVVMDRCPKIEFVRLGGEPG